jgi:ribosomal protein L44E
MSEHYTKNVIADTTWCAKCQRHTLHRVDSGRLGPCIDPKHPVPAITKKQEKRRREQEKERQQPRLFT